MFWFSLLDYKHLQLQMLLAEHTNLPACRFRKHMAIEETCSVIVAPGNIHPNKLCSSPSSAWSYHELCKAERSQPGEAVAGAVGQQYQAGQYRRHHALLFKNKALLEMKRWGGVCVCKIIPKLTLVLCCSAQVKVLLKISIQQNHLINLTG